MAKHFKADDLVIEIDCPKGERFGFPPCENDFGPQRRLRSRHDLTKLTPGARGHLGKIASHMPKVPGQHVILNIGMQMGRLIDPLAWEENRPILDKIDGLIKSSPVRDVFVNEVRPIREKELKLTNVQVATWLEHMRRAVRSHTIRPVDEMEEDYEISFARVVQDWKSLLAIDKDTGQLTLSDEDVAKVIPEWSQRVVAMGGVGGSRSLPRTAEEMKWFNMGLWPEYRKRRGIEEMEEADA